MTACRIHRYTAPVIDVLRHLSFDVLVAVVAGVNVGVSAKVAKLHDRSDDDGALETSTSSNETTGKFQSHVSELTTLSVPSTGPTSTAPPQSYFRLPQFVLNILDLLILFLFWLTGVSVPSIFSLWYFCVFLVLNIMWSTHFKHIRCVSRMLRLVSLVYSAVHLIVLYLYQFQSFQLAAPSTEFVNTNNLLARYVIRRYVCMRAVVSCEYHLQVCHNCSQNHTYLIILTLTLYFFSCVFQSPW